MQCHATWANGQQYLFLNASGPFNSSPQEKQNFVFYFLKIQKLAAIIPYNTTPYE